MRTHGSKRHLGIGIAVAIVLGAHPLSSSAASPEAAATREWRTKRTRLGIGIGIGLALTTGGIAATIAGASKGRAPLVAGIALMGVGGVITGGTTGAFVHHDRWDFAAWSLGENGRALAKEDRQSSVVGIVISLAAIAGGSVAIGVSAGGPLSQRNVGVGVTGGVLVGLGLPSLAAFATIRALHDRHRHYEAKARVQPSIGGLRITF